MWKLSHVKNVKGFTLVEIIVVLAIFAMIIGLGGTIILSSGNIFTKNADMNMAKQIGDTVLDLVSEELTYSTSIEADDNDVDFAMTKQYALLIKEDRLYTFDMVSDDFFDLYGEEFYNNFHINLTINQITLPLITVNVEVFTSENGLDKNVYTNSETIKCLNYKLYPSDFNLLNSEYKLSDIVISYNR